jgi:hypothetical protein
MPEANECEGLITKIRNALSSRTGIVFFTGKAIWTRMINYKNIRWIG